MQISINSNSFAPTTKEYLKEIFNSIIDNYDTLHSVQLSIKSKYEHERELAEDAYKPLDESDSKTKELLERIKSNNNG